MIPTALGTRPRSPWRIPDRRQPERLVGTSLSNLATSPGNYNLIGDSGGISGRAESNLLGTPSQPSTRLAGGPWATTASADPHHGPAPRHPRHRRRDGHRSPDHRPARRKGSVGVAPSTSAPSNTRASPRRARHRQHPADDPDRHVLRRPAGRHGDGQQRSASSSVPGRWRRHPLRRTAAARRLGHPLPPPTAVIARRGPGRDWWRPRPALPTFGSYTVTASMAGVTTPAGFRAT